MTKPLRLFSTSHGIGLAALLGLLAGCGQQAATPEAAVDPVAGAESTPEIVDPATGQPVGSYPRDEPAGGSDLAAGDAALTAPPIITVPPATSAPNPPVAARPSSSRSAAGTAPAAATDSYARVVSVKPVKRSIDTPREVCHEETQTYARAPKDDNRIAGAVIGGVIGGVAGSQVGSGRGRDAATVAGAIGGVVAGRRIQEENQRRNQQAETRTETVCKTVTDSVEVVYAYDIDYEYGGRVMSARIDHDPGERVKLPVRSIAE